MDRALATDGTDHNRRGGSELYILRLSFSILGQGDFESPQPFPNLDPATMAELIRASFFSGYLDLVAELDGDPGKLLRASGISRKALLDGETMLDQRAASLLLERSAVSLRCPDFGIRMTARQDLSVAGPLAVVIRNSATIGDAYRNIARYLMVFGSAPRLVIDQKWDLKAVLVGTELWMRSPGAFPQTMELFVSGMHRILRLLSGERARARAVYFQHAAVSPMETYRRAFSGPTEFSCPMSGLLISLTDWERKIEGRDSEVDRIARAYLDLQSRLRTTDLTSQVRRLVSALLASGKARRVEVADTLKIHERTLIRRLSEEGTSFEEILEQERLSLAERLIAQSELAISQISELLGYSEQSSFTRSHRRWFGETPAAARRRLRNAEAGHAPSRSRTGSPRAKARGSSR